MTTVTELRNEAQEALETAKAILEERAEATDQETKDNLHSRYKKAWKDYEDKASLLKDAEAAAEAEKAMSAPENQAVKPSETRSPGDADWVAGVSADKANTVPDGHIQIAEGTIVPYATRETEGFIRGYAASVQHPSIMQRYGAELRTEKALQEEAFAHYLRRGRDWMKANRPDLMKPLNALQEDTDSEGGYFVPTDQRMDVILDPGAPGGVTRPISSTFTTTRDSGNFPTFTDGDWIAIAEEASPSNTDPSMGQVAFSIKKSGANTIVSEELLADSGVNLPALLARRWNALLGRYEDQQAVEGDNTNEPLGLRTTGAGQGDVADITNLLTLTGPTHTQIIQAWAELPAQFRGGAVWHTTSSFFGTLAQIVDGNGNAIFLRELTMSPQRTLMGNRIVMFDGTGWDSGSLDLAANAEVGAFGDFSQYYFIDRIGMSVRRDDSRYADSDQVLFRARKRYDSFFAENNAFRILKAAAA